MGKNRNGLNPSGSQIVNRVQFSKIEIFDELRYDFVFLQID
jgi:hypothetical protein